MLEWNDYPVILAIAKGKSLYRAARELDVAISTVMRRIAQIEERAGTALFRKTEQGYVATPVGDILVAKAKEIERLTLEADQSLRSQISADDRRIRVSASEVIAPFFVARHLSALKNHCPDCDIELSISTQSPSQTSENFDVSLWPSTPSNEDLYGRRLTQVKWATYGTNAGDSVSSTVALFGREGAHTIAAMQVKNQEKGQPSVSTNSLIASAALAATGSTRAFLPCILGAGWPGLNQLSAPQDHEIGELWAIYRKEAVKKPHINAALDALSLAAKRDKALFLGV